MKHKLLLIVLLNLAILPLANAQKQSDENQLLLQEYKYGKGFISVGNINLTVNDKFKVKPDVAEFTVTYKTEGNSYKEASDKNAVTMKEFNQFLLDSGLKKADLTTVSYRNLERQIEQPIKTKTVQYQSSYVVQLYINQNLFFKVTEILDKNGIHNIKQNNYDFNLKQSGNISHYVFNLQEVESSREKAKQLVQQKYQNIVDELKKLGDNTITVSAYDNQENTQDTNAELVKKYYVLNTLALKVKNFDLIGKIMAKAQALNISVNNDLSYSVSDEVLENTLQQHEKMLYKKLEEKADRLLGNHYQLGVANYLNYTATDDFPIQKNPRLYAQSLVAQEASIDNKIDIQTPEDLELTLTMEGSFEIVRKIIN